MCDVRVLQYQLECLKAELDYLDRSKGRDLPPPLAFCRKHAQQFYWTFSRALKLLREDELSRRGWDRVAPLQTSADGQVSRDADEVSVGKSDARIRLLIDTTSTVMYGGRGGIQRAMRALSAAALRSGVGLPVMFYNGRLSRP